MAFWERWQGPIVQQDGYSVRLHNSESECQDLLYKTPEQHPLGRDDGSTIHCVQNSRRPLLQLYNIRLLALSDRQIRPHAECPLNDMAVLASIRSKAPATVHQT